MLESNKSLLSTCKFQLSIGLATFAEGWQRRLTKRAPPPPSSRIELHSKLQEKFLRLLQQGKLNILLQACSPKMAGPFYIPFLPL